MARWPGSPTTLDHGVRLQGLSLHKHSLRQEGYRKQGFASQGELQALAVLFNSPPLSRLTSPHLGSNQMRRPHSGALRGLPLLPSGRKSRTTSIGILFEYDLKVR